MPATLAFSSAASFAMFSAEPGTLAALTVIAFAPLGNGGALTGPPEDLPDGFGGGGGFGIPFG